MFKVWTGELMLDSAFSINPQGRIYDIQKKYRPEWIPRKNTGLKDKNGKEIFEGDILNICFTSGSGEFIHDGIYVSSRGSLGDLNFDFKKLAWESSGHNQYPIHSTLCERYGSLSTVYADDRAWLITPDKYTPDSIGDKDFPFNNHKELSFNSRYFKVIGNIYENPELVEMASDSDT